MTGQIAGLSQFISRSTEKRFPFFKILRNGTHFAWTEEAQWVFEELKKFLIELPLLTKLMPGEDLVLYVSVGQEAISFVLLQEEGGEQNPIYYISKLLHGAEQRYADLDKGAFALSHTAQKLQPYFLAYKVGVRTLGRMNASGWQVKLAVEMNEYDVGYELRGAIKAQVPADFMQEMDINEQHTTRKFTYRDNSFEAIKFLFPLKVHFSIS